MAQWRTTRKKRRPIPDRVWDAVFPLIGHYPYSTISRELGLSYQQIKNKLATRREAPFAKQNAFVSVDLASTFLNEDKQKTGHKVILTKPNGISLVIEGAPLHLITEIVARMVSQSC